jgi:hypothetical protein
VGGRRGDLDLVPGHEAVGDEGFHGLLPSRRMHLPKAPHPNPPHKGEGGTRRPPPAHNPTDKAPPLPLVGRGGGRGAGEGSNGNPLPKRETTFIGKHHNRSHLPSEP